MKSIDITQCGEGLLQQDVRKKIADNSKRVLIDYPMSSINSSNSYLDITHNYIEASYIADELGKYSASIKAQEIPRYPYSPICRLEIVVSDLDAFSARLSQLSVALSEEQEEEDIIIEHQENLSSYIESLDDRVFVCPDLVDGYYANFVGAADQELDSECDEGFLDAEYRKYPERKYGFWRSAYSATIGSAFYASRECWVVPRCIDIARLLTEYSDLPFPEEHGEAVTFSIGGVSYLANESGVVYFPLDALLHAKKFVASVLIAPGLDGISSRDYTSSPIADEVLERYGIEPKTKISRRKYLLSRSNMSVIVEAGGFLYVFFPDQVKRNKSMALYEQMSALFGFIGDFAGVHKSVELSWEDFDDEKFEMLCYDILYHSPKFDRETIRKMGKSRSRDGGRDIVVFTKERPGVARRLYIFQCKLARAATSLATRRVGNISDTVIQYRAQGYGVMTSTVIDAALYDRIDDICRNLGVESDNWSGFEIERFVAQHPNLKHRYFNC